MPKRITETRRRRKPRRARARLVVLRGDQGNACRVLTGDCLDVLRTLPDASVHCCVTSPPYWGLRDYGTAKWDGGDPACDHVASVKYGVRTNLANAANKCDGGNRKQENRKDEEMSIQYRETCGKCGATRIDQQIGLEGTPEAYVARMVEVFREVRRVLRDDGTLWLNLGDSYASDTKGSGGPDTSSTLVGTKAEHNGQRMNPIRLKHGLKRKDLVGIPWRVAFALQAHGWYLRQDIIWAKPNPMPESVRDRCTKAHEYIFLLTKSARYYYDAEAVREPFADERMGNPGNYRNGYSRGAGRNDSDTKGRAWNEDGTVTGRNRRSVWTVATDEGDVIAREACPCGCGHVFEVRRPPMDAPEPSHEYMFLLTKSARYYYDAEAVKEAAASIDRPQPKPEDKTVYRGAISGGADNRYARGASGYGVSRTGRNRRSVWTVAPQPYSEAHFATFPPALIEPCIKAGTSERGCCPTCGTPWVRVVEKDRYATRPGNPIKADSSRNDGGRAERIETTSRTVGWRSGCKCGGLPVPCTVLDPFFGAGTTGLVALQLGRSCVGIDLNPAYCDLARRRLAHWCR